MSDAITCEARGPLRLMGLNQVEKRNALDLHTFLDRQRPTYQGR